ncbi:hypothetical protein [Nocardia sp. NBC_00511]|uniref:hypothetical protein n=1 Tax=Nocardia sp. NBC_00511 TaxID=2903591 RepID=UPI0030E26F4A
MALRITDWLITSDITPETAHRHPLVDGGCWQLSWLGDRLLTREQAIDGMILDELLSHPVPGDGEFVLRLAATRARELGLGLPEILVRLYGRILERDRRPEPLVDADCGRQSRTGSAAVQRFSMGCLSVSALLSRTLFAAASLPSLCFVAVALLTARVTSNGWAVTVISLATSTLTCAVTVSGSR